MPGDYDGDGETDIAVFEPTTGTWYILGSSVGFFSETLGNMGTVPVPGDYDGDGRCDVATYEASSGRWLILNSRSGDISTANWGYAMTSPSPCDYDGDNLCDIAVLERSSGRWFILQSTTGYRLQNWGYSGTIPVVPQDLINRILNLTP